MKVSKYLICFLECILDMVQISNIYIHSFVLLFVCMYFLFLVVFYILFKAMLVMLFYLLFINPLLIVIDNVVFSTNLVVKTPETLKVEIFQNSSYY